LSSFNTVTSAWKEPLPGFIDNFNGPVGLMVAVARGFLLTFFGNENAKLDYIPVDICTQFMLVAAWCKGVGR
jgi:fatty acyl-CoA reductase